MIWLLHNIINDDERKRLSVELHKRAQFRQFFLHQNDLQLEPTTTLWVCAEAKPSHVTRNWTFSVLSLSCLLAHLFTRCRFFQFLSSVRKIDSEAYITHICISFRVFSTSWNFALRFILFFHLFFSVVVSSFFLSKFVNILFLALSDRNSFCEEAEDNKYTLGERTETL